MSEEWICGVGESVYVKGVVLRISLPRWADRDGVAETEWNLLTVEEGQRQGGKENFTFSVYIKMI